MRLRVRLYLLFVLTLLCSFRLYAFDWPPVTPEELKMTSIPQQPGAPAVVLNMESIFDDPHHSRSFYVRIKVLTEAGKKFADVEIPYSRQTLSEVNSVRGRTIQPDGTISNFEGKPYDRILEKGNGHTWKVKSFAIPNVQVGSIVEYRYFVDYDEHWFMPPEWVLQGPIFRMREYFCFFPTEHSVMMRHDVAGRGVRWSWRLPDSYPKPVENTLLHKIELTLNDVPAIVEEPEMPPVSLFRYYVNFYYDTQRGKPAEFWKDEGHYWIKDIEHFTGKRGDLAAAVRSVVAAGDTQEQKARKIYAFVQSLQNLSYTPRRSEAEMKALGLKDARGVEDVLRQKMGDSEDLARLYVAMAHEAGLNARLMRVTTVNETFFDEYYLSFNQLDHEIVLLKLDSGELHLDPGVRFCPFGLLYYRHADTRGLRQVEGKEKETELASILGDNYNDAWLRRDASLKLREEDGQLEGTVEVTYKGQRALILRLEHWRTDEAGKKKVLEDQMKRWLPESAEVELTNKPDWDSDKDLVADFKIVTPAGSRAGKRALLPLDFFHFNKPPRFAHAERLWPIDFHFPFRSTDHFHLLLPPSTQVEQMPATVNEKLPYALYRMMSVSKPGEIEVLRDLMVTDVLFPQAKYPELKGLFDKVKAGDDLEVVLKGASNAVGN